MARALGGITGVLAAGDWEVDVVTVDFTQAGIESTSINIITRRVILGFIFFSYLDRIDLIINFSIARGEGVFSKDYFHPNIPTSSAKQSTLTLWPLSDSQ